MKQDRAKVKKTRMLHRNLLLPFLGLPLRKQDIEKYQTQSNGSDEHVLQSDPGSGTSEQSHNGDVNNTSKPVTVTARQSWHLAQPGDPAPRFRKPKAHGTTLYTGLTDNEARPVRSRQKPGWLNSNNWVL